MYRKSIKAFDIGLGNGFLDMTHNAQATKANINRWDYIKTKKLLHNAKQENTQRYFKTI